jgi:delta8-fatty-acid desaturase
LASKLEADADKQTPPGEARLTPEMLELGPEHDLDLSLEASRSRAYRDLKSRIEAAGLFSAPGSLMGYGADVARYSILAGLAAWLYFTSTTMVGWFASAVALGAFWHQLTCKCFGTSHARY